MLLYPNAETPFVSSDLYKKKKKTKKTARRQQRGESQCVRFCTSSPIKSRLNLRPARVLFFFFSFFLSLAVLALSPSPSPPLPSPVALFSVVRFFLPLTDYTLVWCTSLSLARDGRYTKRRNDWNEREPGESGEEDEERRTEGARGSLPPPGRGGIARLICPITLNNPRDNSIARA